MMKFEAGKKYFGRSIGDSNCIIYVEVAKRTATMITTTEGKRLKVHVDFEGVEYVKPWGTYSMAPQVTAERIAA